MIRVLFELAHPKHYHQFRPIVRALSERHEVLIAAREKDVVLDLLRAENIPFHQYGVKTRGLVGKVGAAPLAVLRYWKMIRKLRPKLIISRSSPYAALTGRLCGARTVVLIDSENVWLNEKFVIPYSDYVITPGSYRHDYGRKHLRVPGFFEETYLSEPYFQPKTDIKKKLGVAAQDRYALVRFVGWAANHDAGEFGFSLREKYALVYELSKYLRVFISSEQPLPEDLLQYQLNTDPAEMHAVLHAADLYVGDSQSMASEAAILGTPAVRFNSFVGPGDFSNFQVLEDRYGLLVNVSTAGGALKTAVALAADADSKAKWARRRAQLGRRGDVLEETLRHLELILSRFAE